VIEVDGGNQLLLGRSQKSAQLLQIDREGAVIVLRVAENPVV
jgi:hypothetical protein